MKNCENNINKKSLVTTKNRGNICRPGQRQAAFDFDFLLVRRTVYLDYLDRLCKDKRNILKRMYVIFIRSDRKFGTFY